MAKGGRKLNNGAKSKSLLLNPAPVSGGKKLVGEVEKTQLSFSFQYFRQIPYFQIGQEDNNWFVSLLARLQDLCGKDSELMADVTAKSQYRLHPIIWSQTNIPLKKDDLNWVPEKYLNNPEIEFQQFEISQATGRVVGFFNETNEIFYIVLLDPRHNIQPTLKTGYRVDKTYQGLTDYEELLTQIERKNVDQKHRERAERMLWIDEELVQVFCKYGIDDWQEKLELILLDELGDK